MLIIEAMRRAESAREVCSLMTSYVETLVFYDTARRLPSGVTALPVRGLGDTAARLACLLDMQEAGLEYLPADTNFAILEEATELFREALYRLNALNTAEVKTYSFERRTAPRTELSLNH